VLIEPLLREGGVLLLIGPAGVGKTQFADRIGLCLATGSDGTCIIEGDEENDGLFATTSRKDGKRFGVVHLCYEGGESEADLVARIDAHLTASNLPAPDNLDIQFPAGAEADIRSTAGRARLRSEVLRLVRAGLVPVVIIDNLTACTPGMKKSAEEEVTDFYASILWPLCAEFGASFVLIGHMNKPAPQTDVREALDRAFGSQAWGALCNAAVMIDIVPGQKHQRRVVCAKSRGFKPFDTVIVNRPEGDCRFRVIERLGDGVAAASRPGPRRTDRAPDLLRILEGKKLWERAALKHKLGCGNDALESALAGAKDLAGDRFVEKTIDARTKKRGYRVKSQKEVDAAGQEDLDLNGGGSAGPPCANGEDKA